MGNQTSGHTSFMYPARGTGSQPSPRYFVLQLLSHDRIYSSHRLCWMDLHGPIVPEKLREVQGLLKVTQQ